MYNSTIKLVYWQLLLYGVHVGHSFANSIIFAAWLIYTYRQNILIINLFKTVLMFKNGYVGLSGACHFSGPIWFINLHRSVELFVNYSARQCGEFCYTTYWIHGLISNWLTLANTFKKLNRMVTTSKKGQFAKLELESSPLIMGRFSWPRASFISSVSTSPHPTKESLYLGIPCLGIVDTNVSGHIVNIAIPGNDDALDCVVFYNTHISQYILEKKYSNVSGWFFRIRKHKRITKFIDWIFNNYISKEGLIDKEAINQENKKKDNIMINIKSNLNYKVPHSTIWTYGLDFFFSKNYGLNNYKEQVDLYEEKDKYSIVDIDYYLLKHRKASIYLTKIINYFILKASWRFNRFIKKKTFKEKLFKRRFLVGFYEKYFSWDISNSNNYLKSRFLVNRFYKTHLKRNKWRFNKFILKFIKFYFIQKFIYYRGFIPRIKANIITKSNLYYISLGLGSKLFNKYLYSNIFDSNNKDLNKKSNFLFKWYYFKQNIIKNLVKILNKKAINKYFKISLKWKANKLLTFILQDKIKYLYIYYMSFFNFYLWNKARLNRSKREYNRYYLKEWKNLKAIQKNYLYINYLSKALSSYNDFKLLFNNLKIKKNKLIYFFNILTKDYRKSFFLDINNSKFDRLLTLPKYFKKIIKKNEWRRKKIYRTITRKIKAFIIIKNPKDYKGKKKYQKKIYYKRTVLKKKSELKLLRNNFNIKYKRNKYLKNIKVDNFKYLTFSSYLNNLSKINNKVNKIKYLYENKINMNELQFINITYNKLNNYKANNKLIKKEKITLKIIEQFFDNYQISIFRFNYLLYRYYYPYYYNWGKIIYLNNKLIKLYKNKNILFNNSVRNNIIKNYIYLVMKKKAYRVFTKYKIIIKGVSNYILLGNNILNSPFINKYWYYVKNYFNYPDFFYCNYLSSNFRIYMNNLQSLFSSNIYKKKKYIKIEYYFFLLRYFSFYYKYYFSFYKNNSNKPKLLFVKYDINRKRIYWI